jgi:type IV secretion system protein VirD4
MWNPLYLPYTLYHQGKTDAAVGMLNDFVTAIAAPQVQNTKDAFWPEMGASYLLGVLLLMMECAAPEEANVASIGALCNENAVPALTKIAEVLRDDTIAGMNLKAAILTPERTRQSILATAYGMVRSFNTQRQLCNMLSGNTVDLKEIGRRKTALYLIIPDEKTTNHFLITMFLKQAYEMLISEAQKEPNRQLPVRVNFVLDEFCNIPHIPDMPAMISAARSRNMRYYLVVQSMHQLRGLYGEDADTIKGNCDNWVFLTSKELTLLNEISELCGSLYSPDGLSRRLISVSQLQRLKKEKGEALIMHCRAYPIITQLADIDAYEDFKGYAAVPMRSFEVPEAKVFSVKELAYNIIHEEVPVPFEN